jgi:hypothetical protein
VRPSRWAVNTEVLERRNRFFHSCRGLLVRTTQTTSVGTYVAPWTQLVHITLRRYPAPRTGTAITEIQTPSLLQLLTNVALKISKTLDTAMIDDEVLALLYLGLHDLSEVYESR